jgi:cell envelope opacity-associated protein A
LLDLAKERMDNARDQNKGLPVTLKPDPGLYCSQCRPTLEVPPDKDGSHTANIRATLASYNLPNSSGKENVKQLTNFAAMNGKKLILTKNVEPVQKDDKKVTEKTGSKKDIKIKQVQEVQSDSPKEDMQAEKPKKTFKLKTSGKAA